MTKELKEIEENFQKAQGSPSDIPKNLEDMPHSILPGPLLPGGYCTPSLKRRIKRQLKRVTRKIKRV